MQIEIIVALVSLAGSLLGIGLKAYFDFRKVKLEYCLKQKKAAAEKPKLATHILFNRLTMYTNQVETTFSIPNKGKEAVFRCLLLAKIKIGYDTLLALAEEIDERLDTNQDISSTEIYTMFKNNIEQSLSEMEIFFLKDDSYTAEERECLKIVSKKFECWHYPRIQYVMETIYTVCCASLFYKDAYSKAVSIFDTYCSVYSDLLNDAQHTLNSLNGDLNGLKFKNYSL
jgi:predicted DNA-binding protein